MQGIGAIELDLDPIDLLLIQALSRLVKAAQLIGATPTQAFDAAATSLVTMAQKDCKNADEFAGMMAGIEKGLMFGRVVMCAGLDPAGVKDALTRVNEAMRAMKDDPPPKEPKREKKSSRMTPGRRR